MGHGDRTDAMPGEDAIDQAWAVLESYRVAGRWEPRFATGRADTPTTDGTRWLTPSDWARQPRRGMLPKDTVANHQHRLASRGNGTWPAGGDDPVSGFPARMLALGGPDTGLIADLTNPAVLDLEAMVEEGMAEHPRLFAPRLVAWCESDGRHVDGLCRPKGWIRRDGRSWSDHGAPWSEDGRQRARLEGWRIAWFREAADVHLGATGRVAREGWEVPLIVERFDAGLEDEAAYQVARKALRGREALRIHDAVLAMHTAWEDTLQLLSHFAAVEVETAFHVIEVDGYAVGFRIEPTTGEERDEADAQPGGPNRRDGKGPIPRPQGGQAWIERQAWEGTGRGPTRTIAGVAAPRTWAEAATVSFEGGDHHPMPLDRFHRWARRCGARPGDET